MKNNGRDKSGEIPPVPPGQEPKPPGNGHVTREDLETVLEEVKAQGTALRRVINHLSQPQQQQQPLVNPRERRDLLEMLTDPPEEVLPALTDVQPLMATLIPAMNVIRWNFTPISERPKNPATGRPYGLYMLWEIDYARWSLSKNAHNAIRLCDVVQTRQGETMRMGINAD